MTRETIRRARAHWLIGLILAGGLALRVLALCAYRPAIIYVDSLYIYLNHLPGSTLPFHHSPAPDPLGYNMLLLQPALAVGDLATVVIIQHLLGLAMGVTVYVVLRRATVWRWLAALAAAPVLLDAYQIQIEHMIMSDTLFEALLTTAFAAMAWRRRPTNPAVVIAAVALGAACTVRAVGMPLFAVFLIYLLAVRKGWGGWSGKLIASGALLVAAVMPLGSYQIYASVTGIRTASDDVRSTIMYARVATFVDCSRLRLPSYERQLCPKEPLNARRSPDYYAHTTSSPLFHVTLPPGKTLNDLTTDFSIRAIKAQPLGLARAIGVDALRAFTWNHSDYSNPDAPTERWRFQATFPLYPDAVTPPVLRQVTAEYGGGPPRWRIWPAALLRAYQLRVGFTPGPAMALAWLLALLALLARVRLRRGSGASRRAGAPMRGVAALYLAGGASVLLIADAFEFTWRYQLPGLVLIPLAGALGLRALCWRPAAVPFPHPDDVVAINAFDKDYPGLKLPPVVVIIAAYNEAAGIGRVLDGVPARVPALTPETGDGAPAVPAPSASGVGTAGEAGTAPDAQALDVATIVVIDGGSDDTGAIAVKHGAHVATLPRNRGQGAALRLGYFLARRGGARYLVTTDADGQYDIAALPAMLAPLRRGEADFVTGSRALGVNESTDRMRRAGTRFFAMLVRVLTGFRSTDTSFGMRAMRAAVTGEVTLNQPQYQASELLIGLIMRGFRVVEIPATMRVRGNGRSKKGNNLVYGWRYARVVLSTWWRERRLRRARTRVDAILSGAPTAGAPAAGAAEAAGPEAREPNTNRSNTKNLATNMTAKAPK